MRSHGRLLRRLLFAILAVALVLAPARPARAGAAADIGRAIGIALGGGVILGADVVYTVHDASVAEKGERPSRGWSMSETFGATPQAIIANGFLVAGLASGESKGFAPVYFLLPSIWTSALSTHGIWGVASKSVHPGTLFGASWAIGANLAFTSGALGAAFDDRLPGAPFGVVEMLGTTPTIAVGISRLVDPKGTDKGAWAALTAWSGALFVHGVASLVTGLQDKGEEEQQSEQGDDKPRDGARFYLAPTIVSDGVARVPGIVAGGFF
jgi:hypothetical protein